jgi:hypothetical protein
MADTTYDINLISEETGERIANATELIALAQNESAKGSLTWAGYGNILRKGLIADYAPVGTPLKVERETGLTVTVTGGITGATVNEATFIEATDHAGVGAYEFIYDGAAWHLNGEAVELSAYGIVPTGTAVEGDTIVVHEQASVTIFETADIDYDAPVDSNIMHTVSAVSRDCLHYDTFPFSAPQALGAVDATLYPSGIAANTPVVFLCDHCAYNGGTAEDANVYFVPTQAIPAGGKIKHTQIGKYRSSYALTTMLSGTFSTYDAQGNLIESGLATVERTEEITGEVIIGTTTAYDPQYKTGHANFSQRNQYGSNRYLHSNHIKWANSDAAGAGSGQIASWWYASDEFDMPVKSTLPGFLHGIDPELKKRLVTVRKRVRKHQADGGGYEDVLVKVWDPSMTELGYGNNGDVKEGAANADGTLKSEGALALFNGVTDAERIKKYNGTARYYFHRSPNSNASSSDIVRRSKPSGALDPNGAHLSHGQVLGLTIGA